MKPIAVIYGSTTDNTKNVAGKIAKLIGNDSAELLDVSTIHASDVEAYANLILGTSTWGDGELQDDWDNFMPELKNADLKGKTVALFGLGNASFYPDTFVNGMGVLYQAIKEKGCSVVGQVANDGYTFDNSLALGDGNQFVGLPLDVENEDSLTDSRLKAWVESILPLFQ
jgi:flavodoxin I